MVVQRDMPVHVWGMAAPGESVSVSFRGESCAVKAGELGRWSVYLGSGGAGGPFKMVIKGVPAAVEGNAAPEQTITLDDVLVGDVWVASGQSNMQFRMRQTATAAADLPHAGIDRIRLLEVKENASEYPLEDVADVTLQGWTASTPETAKEFSAVAWYFARDIEQKEHVPVGVIDSTWGGTVAESWTRLTALGEDAALAPVFVSRGKMVDHEADRLLEDAEHEREIAAAKTAGKPEPSFGWQPSLEMWAPGLLYNGMIAPLTRMPIRGVIWYQGESNSALERAPLYHRIFRTLIEDWRKQWGEGDFPFLFVQIANFKSGSNEDWALLREQQVKTLELRNTAMAVTIDIGNPDDVHPTDKVDVGDRLARAARAVSYGEAVEYQGPVFRQATPEGNSLHVWFDHAKGMNFRNGAATGFEVAGADGKWVSATAKVEGASVVVSSPEMAEPVAVRYGWANSPECHLYNSEGLAASPFNSRD
jgi:sialate O-acetylesterase